MYLQKDFGSVFGRIHLRIPETPITRPTHPENKRAANQIKVHPSKASINIFYKIKIYSR